MKAFNVTSNSTEKSLLLLKKSHFPLVLWSPSGMGRHWICWTFTSPAAIACFCVTSWKSIEHCHYWTDYFMSPGDSSCFTRDSVTGYLCAERLAYLTTMRVSMPSRLSDKICEKTLRMGCFVSTNLSKFGTNRVLHFKGGMLLVCSHWHHRNQEITA